MKHLDVRILKKAVGEEAAKTIMERYARYNPRSRADDFVPSEHTIELLRMYLNDEVTPKEMLDDPKWQGSANVYYVMIQTVRWLNKRGDVHIFRNAGSSQVPLIDTSPPADKIRIVIPRKKR